MSKPTDKYPLVKPYPTRAEKYVSSDAPIEMQPQPGAPAGPGGEAPHWMPMPQAPAGCPPGLEYLTKVDQILVHQVVEALECWETKNHYALKNSLGQQVFWAGEESSFCMRQCCKEQRSFTIHVANNQYQEVIRVRRDYKCFGGCIRGCCACCNCCSHEVTVECPPDNVVGYVTQECSMFRPNFSVRNADKEVVFEIKGPCCCVCDGPLCCGDRKFRYFSPDGTKIGKITKQYSGFVKEAYTDADNFGITFPLDLDVSMKATLIGAVFLIDFMFFETGAKRDDKDKHDH